MTVPPPQPSDDELAARLRDGDRGAFEALFRAQYAPLVRHAARMTGSTAEAEELVQEVFLQLWSRRDALAIRESPVAYLYRGVRNRALNAVRHERVVRNWAAAQPPEASEPAVASADTAAEDEVARAVRDAIAALPERCREIFLLSREQGLTYAQIAATLELSIKTVETQMGRALKSLRERLAAFRR